MSLKPLELRGAKQAFSHTDGLGNGLSIIRHTVIGLTAFEDQPQWQVNDKAENEYGNNPYQHSPRELKCILKTKAKHQKIYDDLHDYQCNSII